VPQGQTTEQRAAHRCSEQLRLGAVAAEYPALEFLLTLTAGLLFLLPGLTVRGRAAHQELLLMLFREVSVVVLFLVGVPNRVSYLTQRTDATVKGLAGAGLAGFGLRQQMFLAAMALLESSLLIVLSKGVSHAGA
jgi:hypothetical protein